ncbi:hypothetical protein AU467_00995 [Mesorhizobium loti]|uniref:Uncharacterized protein n=1 Tax=Rhizobium loti TaxID=381 RepID=A0A101KXP9_RHILI|nr:hypothetical protein AU467_00995 [Mesorhizobium loti]
MIACTSPLAMASDTTCVALASASAERSRASASRKAASLRPSASRICDCFRPSAARIWARLSRSAIIWRPIDSTRLAGGLMSLISTRVILMPHGCAASSTTRSRRSLIASRLDSNSSRSIEPMTVRMLVMVRLRMAFCRPETW